VRVEPLSAHAHAFRGICYFADGPVRVSVLDSLRLLGRDNFEREREREILEASASPVFPSISPSQAYGFSPNSQLLTDSLK
jgi:hypothetical protein